MDNKEANLTNGCITDNSQELTIPIMNELNFNPDRSVMKKKSVSLSYPVLEANEIEKHKTENGIFSDNDGQEDIIQIATLIVKEVIEKAESNVSNNRKITEKDLPCSDLLNDPKVLEMVREFISQVLTRAKEEAFATVRCQSRAVIGTEEIESTFIMKEEQIGDRWIGGLKRKHWYIRASKFFANAFERMCLCKASILH